VFAEYAYYYRPILTKNNLKVYSQINGPIGTKVDRTVNYVVVSNLNFEVLIMIGNSKMKVN
jgi:hypothetical protein